MSSDKPLVSIGMLVYNAERFISQSLDSLLAQDYENFELIISDNASTDRSAEICQEYVAKDERIRYYRNETNLGSVENANRLFELSSGKYFMWASDHDLWQPTFTSTCVSALEEEPEVVLAYSQTMLIDSDGNPLKLMPEQIDTRGMPTVRRYKYLIWNLTLCNMMYGIIRREVLGQAGRIKKVLGANHPLLADLALRGTFAQIAKPLFYRRENRPDEDPKARTKRRVFDIDPVNAPERSKLSYGDLMRELRDAHLRLVAYAPISFLDKLHAAMATVSCFRSRFGVRWYHSVPLFVRRMAKLFIPKSLRRRLFINLQRL